MKFTESKPKSLIYTILIYVFCLFEMGVLSSYRFVVLGSSLDKCMGMSMSKVNNLAHTTVVTKAVTCFRGQILPGACEY